MKRISQKLNFTSAQKYTSSYLQNFTNINKYSKSPDKLTTSFVFDTDSVNFDIFRLSALMNDVTNVSLHSSGNINVTVLGAEGIKSTIGGDSIEVSVPKNSDAKYLQKLSNGVSAAFVFPNDDSTNALLKEVRPLIECGALLVHPERGLIVLEDTTKDGTNHWHLLGVDEDSPIDLWHASNDESTGSVDFAIPLDPSSGPDQTTSKKIFEIAYPFISNISMQDLARVIEDEQEHLSKVRVALKEVVKNCENQSVNANEILHDILRPELDSLSRRFAHVTKMNALQRAGATVGIATLGLTAALSGGMVGLGAVLGGAGGFGLVLKNEVEFEKEKMKLSENPYYLLWKLQNLKK